MMKKVIIYFFFVLSGLNGFGQSNRELNSDIESILSLYYRKIFIDSTRDNKSNYFLLPQTINVESETQIDSNTIHSQSFSYNPLVFYSTLPFQFKVLSESEIWEIENYLGLGFETKNPTSIVTDLQVSLYGVTESRFLEKKKELDINYTLVFNKEHGVIFNLYHKWLFVSNFSTSRIIFRNNYTEAILRINSSNWKFFGWAYFSKKESKWQIDRVDNIGILW